MNKNMLNMIFSKILSNSFGVGKNKLNIRNINKDSEKILDEQKIR